jgi:hypothetical protein
MKVISLLASPSSLKCEEGKRFTEEINEIVRCANDIEETTKALLKRLRRGFSKG